MAVTLFHYKDEHGEDVVVDDLKAVPEAFRSKVKILDGKSTEVHAITNTKAVVQTAGLDWHSFAIGAASGGGAALVVALVLGRSIRAVRLVLMAGIALALSAGYMTYVRKQAGLGAGIASPTDLVQDAKDAAKAMSDHAKEQQRAIEQAEQLK